MAEIGTFAGEGAEILTRSGRVRLLLCIAPWSDSLDTYPPAEFMADAECRFDRRRLSNVLKLKMTSTQAARCIADGSLDVVYIDGDHRYDSVRDDLAAFMPKLRPGGWMAGHDYDTPGVTVALFGMFSREPDEVYGDGTWVYRT
jgi:predicted O-methyltransferase YrrM